ncbi:two-component response regulator ARR18-like [Hibiscus syriacus]|uniref:two-component response regulator ARR18-like n=1 Tax=Hibiscus syriacus TaxID=106335 RepID=UPI0019210185|nr:two-component response regulator ARR18-like [Hibiscus syriacus]
MERNSSTECSKTTTTPSKQNHLPPEAESETEDNDGESKPRNVGSSSNSTVEENDKKPSVRPYVRSKTPRLRWTPDLHLGFIHAVERLGGQDRATPKLVLQLMNIKGLSIAHVKSHLQMYRSKKIDDPRKAMNDHRHLVESGDRNIYNFNQLPMLQGYKNHHQSSRYIILIRASFIDEQRPGLHGTVMERIFGSNRTTNYASPFNVLKKEFSSFLTHPSTQPKVEYGTSFSRNSAHGRKAMKRSISDSNLDLDLSLRLTLLNEERRRLVEEDDVGRDLSLSLCSPPLPSKVSRLEGEDSSRGSGRRVSTLDLTI